jgi:GDSL-like Lipase/Acylhydrolase
MRPTDEDELHRILMQLNPKFPMQKLIDHGARHVLVPGNLPSGCIPIMLTFYPSSNKEDYDPHTGCLKNMNSLALYHNAVLRIAIEKLNKKYPEARIIYGDYYGPVVQFARTPELFGECTYIFFLFVQICFFCSSAF